MPRLPRLIISVVTILLLWSCASQTTPTGGPKDETPPKLIRSNPIHKQRNFKGNSIELEFNELVNLNNPKDEILISPSIGKDVEFKVKKNTVTITSPKGWEDNTTYSISFREGIKDITEKNAPKNLRLAFSTGPLIDSLFLAGRITLAIKESIPENITVALYKSDTFNIFEHTPNYFTISEKTGKFSIENVKNGSYRIYAFEDKNKNLKVESRTEKYGFLSNWIELNTLVDSLTISLINLDSRKLTLNNIRNNGLFTRLKFNKNIISYSLQSKSQIPLVNSYGDDQTEIVIYNPKNLTDSLRITLTATDSVNFQIDTLFHIKSFEQKFIPGDFTIKTEIPKYDLNTNSLSVSMKLSKPLLEINYDSLFILVDSTTQLHFSSAEISYDSTYKKLSIAKTLALDTLFRTIEIKTTDSITSKINPNQREVRSRTNTIQFKPLLKLGGGAFISIEKDSSKNKEIEIPPANKTQTGTLLIEAITKEPSFVIQLMNSSGVILNEVRNTAKHTFENLNAQSYKIRVVIDKNNNGQWDVGNVYQNEEPERIFFYRTADKKYEFPIRANWELGPLMLIF